MISMPDLNKVRFIISRMGIIYVILAVFILVFVDIQSVDKRIRIRRLNSLRPDFTQLNNFQNASADLKINWKPYRSYFELVLSYIPNDPIAANFLGYLDYYSGQEESAISRFEAASAFSSDLFWPDYNLGIIYYKKGKYDKALEHLNRVISADSNKTLNYMHNSVLYRQVLANAPADVSLQTELSDALSMAYLVMEMSLERLGQYESMLTIVLPLIKKDISYLDAHLYYGGLACLHLNRLDKAVLLLERSLKIEKNNPMTYFYLSKIYDAAGKQDAAAELIKVYQVVKSAGNGVSYEQQLRLRYF